MKYSKKCAQADAGDTGAPASAASRDEKPPRPLAPTLSMVNTSPLKNPPSQKPTLSTVNTCKQKRETQLLAGYGGAGEKEGEIKQCGTVAAAAAAEAKSK